MHRIKQALGYFVWIFISLLAGIAHMRIILGPKPKPSSGILKMFDWAYGVSLFHVGLVIGSIIAFLFIIIDHFYLKKRLAANANRSLIRLLVILILALIVGTTHYICEEVIDII